MSGTSFQAAGTGLGGWHRLPWYHWSRDGIRPITSRTTGHVMESGQSQASIEPCIHNAPMQGLTSTHTHSTIHLQSWIRSKHTCLILRIIKSATHTGMELPDGHKIKVSFIITIQLLWYAGLNSSHCDPVVGLVNY